MLARYAHPHVGEFPATTHAHCPGRVTAAACAGRTLRFVHNWSWAPATFTPPAPVRDVPSGALVESLALGPWDVRILEEIA